MAEIPWSEEYPPAGEQWPPGTRVIKWELDTGDVGKDFIAPDHSDKCMQVTLKSGTGTFGGTASVTMRGHNFPTGTPVYGTVRDSGATAISGINVDGAIRQLADNPYALSPQIVAAGGVDIEVRLVVVKQARR